MNSLFLIISMAIALACLSTAAIYGYARYAMRYRLLDIPNARSLHQTTVPRGAGIVFVLLWFASLLFLKTQHYLSFQDLALVVPGTLLVSVLGFVDDRYSIGSGTRLIIQCLAAGLFLVLLGDCASMRLFGSAPVSVGVLGPILVLLALVWSINAYNFMDGMDGISGVEAISVFGMGGWLFGVQGAQGMALASLSMVCVVVGFLVWNWPKAKVFMGDAGSYALGFSVVAFALIGDHYYGIPLMLWLILYGVFCFDASVTLMRRLCKGESLATAHCLHAYQRLHRAGFRSSRILAGLCLVNTVLAGIVYYVTQDPNLWWVGFLLALSLLTAVYLWVERINPMWPVPTQGTSK